MIKKLVLLLVILMTSYGVSIFVAPGVASTIDNLIGMPWLSESLRGKKSLLEWAITDIPSINEVKSWALDFKEKFETWVSTTKDTIDSIRESAQTAEDTYNDVKDTYDELKDTFSGAAQMLGEAGEKLEEIQWVVESVNQLSGSGS